MTKSKSFWRGYIDSQGPKNHYAMSEWEIVTAAKSKTLLPLSEILKVEIEKYRSGFFVVLPNKWHSKLPLSKDLDYLRGWFAAKGRIYEDPDLKGKIKLTITGINVEKFHTLVGKLCKISLPAPQTPSKTSDTKRIIVTGQSAKQLLSIIEGEDND